MQSKRKTGHHAEPSAGEPQLAFAERPASQAWERISLAHSPQNYVWAWFKPATAPQGLILRVPDETYRDHPELAAQWTMRTLLQAARVEPAVVSAWMLNGATFPGMNGASPYFDAPLPAPVVASNPDIVVYVHGTPIPSGPPLPAGPLANMPPYMAGAPVMGAVPMAPAMPMTPLMPMAPAMPMAPLPMGMHVPPAFTVPPMYNGAPLAAMPPGAVPGPPLSSAHAIKKPLDAATADVFERIEADWNSSNEIEKDLARVRKQLVDILGRLKTLNRELTPPERVHSNNQDKKDWQDARRALRDATNRVWKYLKAHDIGDTSNAGKRVWFDEIYRKFIAPRQMFDELMAAARAFESHRKTITQLHCDMSNAYSFASLDGERKAQQVISRIQTKVREASNKKNFLGVILDS
jgi:hypothetical protein